jgi:hypothetical protein
VTCNSRAAKAVDDDVMGEKMKSKALLLHQCCVMKIVLVEIERRPSDTWGAESGESTLRSRRIDHDDFFLDSADRSDGLARLGDELELYTTRPGVRRRIFHYTNANCVHILAQSPNQRNLMPLLNCEYASIHRLSTHMQLYRRDHCHWTYTTNRRAWINLPDIIEKCNAAAFERVVCVEVNVEKTSSPYVMKIVIILDEIIIKVLAPQVQIAF